MKHRGPKLSASLLHHRRDWSEFKEDVNPQPPAVFFNLFNDSCFFVLINKVWFRVGLKFVLLCHQFSWYSLRLFLVFSCCHVRKKIICSKHLCLYLFWRWFLSFYQPCVVSSILFSLTSKRPELLNVGKNVKLLRRQRSPGDSWCLWKSLLYSTTCFVFSFCFWTVVFSSAEVRLPPFHPRRCLGSADTDYQCAVGVSVTSGTVIVENLTSAPSFPAVRVFSTFTSGELVKPCHFHRTIPIPPGIKIPPNVPPVVQTLVNSQTWTTGRHGIVWNLIHTLSLLHHFLELVKFQEELSLKCQNCRWLTGLNRWWPGQKGTLKDHLLAEPEKNWCRRVQAMVLAFSPLRETSFLPPV